MNSGKYKGRLETVNTGIEKGLSPFQKSLSLFPYKGRGIKGERLLNKYQYC